MTKNNSREEIISKLNKAQNVAIFCHVRPDGDALGSALALCLALKNAGKNVCVANEDGVAPSLNLFPAMGYLQIELKTPLDKFDTLIAVDSASSERLGVFENSFLRFKGTTINIDHHVSNTMYAKYNYVLERSANCEILPTLIQDCGFVITKEIAELLALGLITDSGNFAHSDVTADTLRVAALLKENGADLANINYEVMQKQTKGKALLFAKVLNKLRFALDDKFAFITVTQKDFEETGTTKDSTEGFVNFPLSIDCVEVSASIMEVKKGQYKISLRGKNVNVNRVAETFGGGGHVLASGCMLFGEYEEVVDKLTYAVYQNL